jgi:hypothetical protein
VEELTVLGEPRDCQIDRCPEPAVGLFEWATPRTTVRLCEKHAETLRAAEPHQKRPSDILLREIVG